MNHLFHKTRVIWLLAALCAAMMSVLPISAAESPLTVSVSDSNLLVSEDGAFAFSITLDSQEAYRAADIGLFVSDGVEITKVAVDNGATAIGPTEARGLVWFGYNTSQAAAGKTVLTVSGVCRGAGDWAVKLESAKITHPDYSTAQVTSGPVINLSRRADTSETDRPIVSDEPVTGPVTPSVSDQPVTKPVIPSVSDDPTTEPAKPTVSNQPTAAPVISSESGEPVTEPADPSESGESSTVPGSPSTTTTALLTGETLPNTQTGDMNVPLLQISCAVIAVIAAGTLIYITYKHKTQKGE